MRWRLTMLLREKESAVSGSLANCWLANEAASIDAILKAGTFRYAASIKELNFEVRETKTQFYYTFCLYSKQIECKKYDKENR